MTATALNRSTDSRVDLSGPSLAVELDVRGVVQGVGFRPFVHRLALRHELRGWVRNEAGAVRIRVEGAQGGIDRFTSDLYAEAPPLARIESVTEAVVDLEGLKGFEVAVSEISPLGRLPVSPDVATCEACASELMDPADRRHRYPFITCTDCGPRFTVISAMPYDRERSTMSVFPQCPTCLAEYNDPTDRRYHSETNSCPSCGPKVWLERNGRSVEGHDAFHSAASLLKDGGILAVRGLGGFHLACDATDTAAVQRLRARKHRDAKPLALMVRTVDEARGLAHVGSEEERLLSCRERPIVVLGRKPGAEVAQELAPGLDTLGVMLAYTPLHLLLLDEVGGPLVMTSGNLSDEPIATGNEEARRRLRSVADAFLLHDREIVARYDDSLVRAAPSGPVFLRRARGYAPLPLPLPVPAPRPILAVGPHLKNTLTLAAGGRAWVSQHVGDLENLETLDHFQDVLRRFQALFRVAPQAVVRDLHPGYLSTRVAEESGLPALPPVQHHHAHIAAVMGEHGVTAPVLGLAFDGTGYGDDGRVWGAEFLLSDLLSYRRLGHLRYAPLPGGDAASRAPWRSALGYLSLSPGDAPAFQAAFPTVAPKELAGAERQLLRSVNAPEASSMGRLFDAAAAVLGIRARADFEGQAPMEVESAAGPSGRVPRGTPLPFPAARDGNGMWVLDPIPLLVALGQARSAGREIAELAGDFHEAVAEGAASLALQLCDEHGLDHVALGGGCFQNVLLLDGVVTRLERAGLRVLVPTLLGPNDGAVSYGQAVVASARLDS